MLRGCAGVGVRCCGCCCRREGASGRVTPGQLSSVASRLPPRCCYHHQPALCTPTRQVIPPPASTSAPPGMESCRAAASRWVCNVSPNSLQCTFLVPQLLAKSEARLGVRCWGNNWGFLSLSLELAAGQEGGTFHFSAVPSLYWPEWHLLGGFGSTAPRRGSKPKLGIWGNLVGLILNQTCRKFCINCLCWVMTVWGEEEQLYG